jgi:SAM-dependent methyltransferase
MPAKPRQRRALTTVKGATAVTTSGAPELAATLRRALEAGRDERVPRELTHGFHAYPARMHAGTARLLVELALAGTGGAARAGAAGARGAARAAGVLLDPFCGSGTTLVEAQRRGARAIGVDANPLAILIARAKTWSGTPARRARLRELAAAIADAVIAEGKQARRAGYVPPAHRAPRGVDPAARERELQRWFAPHVRRELETLAAAIDAERRRDAELAELLTAALSSILYKVSRRESDTAAREVQRAIGRGAASRWFARRAAELADGLGELAQYRAPPARIELGDARRLDRAGVADASVDAIVTSPPYAGTYDYLAHQALRFAFLGISPAGFAAAELGARRRFTGGAEARDRALARWDRDLAAAIAEARRVLRPGGRMIAVVGDSLAGGRTIDAARALARAASGKLRWVATASQGRPALGAAEQRGFAKTPKREHVVVLEREG